jgi:hypothetical protein
MTNYAQLQADIAEWTARDDLGSKPQAFIRIAEASIGRKVRVLEQETDTTLTLNDGNDFAADLPTGYLGFKHVFDSASRNPTTVYIPPQAFHELRNTPRDAFTSPHGSGLHYTIEGNKLKGLASTGSAAEVTLDVCYIQRFAALSDANTTNWLLTYHYDIYLFAALREAWDYIDETEQVAKYQGRFDRAIGELDEQEVRKRIPAGPLVRRPPANAVV